MFKEFGMLMAAASMMVAAPGVVADGDQEKNPFGPWYLSDKTESGWFVDATIGVESEPTYAGSDENETEADADVRAFYRDRRGHRWFVSLGEVGGLFSLGPDTAASVVLEYEEGRDNDDDDTLTGLDEVEETVELQATLARRWGNFSAFAVLQPDILDRGKGFVWFAGIGYDRMINDRLRIHWSADLSGADSEHMNTEFGITPAESIRTGLPAFEAESGLKSVTLEFSGEYQLSSQWSLIGGLEVENYLSNASDSPLIDIEGSSTTYEIGIGVRYRF